jgi:hypothetical protein
MLAYHCPKTQKLVRTTLETSPDQLRRLGAFQLSLWCPHCQTGHQVIASDALIWEAEEGAAADANT